MTWCTVPRPPPPPPDPIATRSFISVVIATVQPSLTSPSTFSCGTRTSSKNTSLKLAPPFICLSGLIDDARRLHVDDERGDALVLLGVGIRAAHDLAVVGVLRARRPDLLAVDEPLVAVARGGGRERRDIGAGAGLAEELRPDLLAAEQLGEVALLLRGVTDRAQRRRDHAEADDERLVRDRKARFFLAEDDLLDRRAVAAAELGLPGDAREPGVELQRLPALGPFEVVAAADLHVVLGRLADDLRGVLLEPGAELVAPRGFFGGVVEVHVVQSRSRPVPAANPEAAAEPPE